MKTVLVLFLALFTVTSWGMTALPISEKVFHSEQMPFLSHGNDNALAMNLPYSPIKVLRDKLSKQLKYNLHFFTGWKQEGEAHVTVITPPEYSNFLKKYMSMQRIEEIAEEMGIQFSDLTILGFGRGTALLNGKLEETYFVIVQSENLLRIRQRIYQEYIQNGGPANQWNPNHFFPHITVGFSLRDLHESDGVIKDLAHTLDSRFQLFLTR